MLLFWFQAIESRKFGQGSHLNAKFLYSSHSAHLPHNPRTQALPTRIITWREWAISGKEKISNATSYTQNTLWWWTTIARPSGMHVHPSIFHFERTSFFRDCTYTMHTRREDKFFHNGRHLIYDISNVIRIAAIMVNTFVVSRYFLPVCPIVFNIKI